MELVGGCYEQILFGFAVRPGEYSFLGSHCQSAEGERGGLAWIFLRASTCLFLLETIEPLSTQHQSICITSHKNWMPIPDFTHHAHTASLSAVAVNNRYVVTGSRDETIQIYDMKKKIEHGALLHHNGTITCLEFYGNAHLLSGAEDGLICIWDTKRWECLKSIKAHKGHVTSLSIHPSGKLALSVGTDKTLRTWNLVEGRSAFIKNLKQNAHIVKWSPSGEKYVVVVTNKVDVYKLETASVSGAITTEKRISSVRFITDSVLAIAGDDEVIRLYDCDSQKCLCEFKAHENRIKDIYSFEKEGLQVIITASSDGYIKLWNLELDKIQDSPSLLCEVNTKARLTCLAVWLDRTSETKENPDNAATSSYVNEDEQPLITRKKKVCWTDDSDKSAKGDRQVTPKKRKSEGAQQKKKTKLQSSK
ncbi:p21-activated protein kinase-interacting protein 1 isoform X2 [Chelonia mydas]|uniref:p21-activated protein kinase-interacting protein 1 isoform X2 n=1 Tax=Chelonia mydas TaxID=8469 RepID=UPI0018A1E8D0|nr:p21-activated protein kinase-interacting protein 1 isoform X2 [Chelonia mydas]